MALVGGAHTVGFVNASIPFINLPNNPGAPAGTPIALSREPRRFNIDYWIAVKDNKGVLASDNIMADKNRGLVRDYINSPRSFFKDFVDVYVKMGKMGASWKSYGPWRVSPNLALINGNRKTMENWKMELSQQGLRRLFGSLICQMHWQPFIVSWLTSDIVNQVIFYVSLPKIWNRFFNVTRQWVEQNGNFANQHLSLVLCLVGLYLFPLPKLFMSRVIQITDDLH